MADVLLQWVQEHGAVGLVLLFAIENLGVPCPTSLAFIAAIELVRLGELTWPGAVALCTFGHVAGSMLGYALGRAGDNILMRRARHHTGPRRAIEWLHRWYERHGSMTVFAARFVGQVRPWASVAAGLGEVRVGPFIVWTALGSLLHTILALWLAEAGWWFWDTYPQWRVVLVVSVTVVFWGVFLYAVLRGRHLRRAAEPETETR